jgi:hypothetical protein
MTTISGEALKPNSVVQIETCVEDANPPRGTCTGSFKVATEYTVTRPPAASFTSCASWQPPLPTVNRALNDELACVIPMGGFFPTAWPVPTKPLSYLVPFDPNEASDLVLQFCTDLTNQKIKIVPPKEATEPGSELGECKRYTENSFRIAVERFNGEKRLAFSGHNISIALAYDTRGCPADPNVSTDGGGVDMAKYGVDQCHDGFINNVVNKCTFPPAYVKGKNLAGTWGNFSAIGGLFFRDCMRWTLVAVDDSQAPPDILYGQNF